MWEIRVGCVEIRIFQICERWESFPRDLGLCWGRCWDNRDQFFHGKGKGAVPGAAGKKKKYLPAPTLIFWELRGGQSQQKAPCRTCTAEIPAQPFQWTPGMGGISWIKALGELLGITTPQKKIPNLQRCWKGSRGAENVLRFVGWGWRGLKKNRG